MNVVKAINSIERNPVLYINSLNIVVSNPCTIKIASNESYFTVPKCKTNLSDLKIIITNPINKYSLCISNVASYTITRSSQDTFLEIDATQGYRPYNRYKNIELKLEHKITTEYLSILRQYFNATIKDEHYSFKQEYINQWN